MRRSALAALLLCPLLALADAGGGGAQEAVSFVFNEILESAFRVMQGSPYGSMGTRLLHMLLLILISWKGIKLALESTGYQMVIAELVQIILLFGIAKFFLEPSVQIQLAQGFDSLATTAASAWGPAMDMSKPQAQIAHVLTESLLSAKHLWDGVPEGAGREDLSWSNFASVLASQAFAGIANLIFRCFIALGIVLCALLYVGQLLFSQVLVNIALLVAPLMVPWLLWESTSFLFNSWLKFMIVAGVQKIVGALLFGMTYGLVAKVTTLASSATATTEMNFYLYASAFLIVGLMAFLMVQSASIANGLISGAPHTAFKPPQGMSPGAAMGRAGSANVGKGISKGMAAGRGAAQGFRDAKSSGGNVVTGALQGARNAIRGGGKAASPGTIKPPATPPSRTGGGGNP